MDFCDSVIATVGGPVVGSVVISAAALAACVTLACWPLTRPAPAMPPNTCAHSSSFRPLLHIAFGQSAAGTVGWRVQCLHKSPFNLPRGMSPFSPPLMWLSSWHRQPTCCSPPLHVQCQQPRTQCRGTRCNAPPGPPMHPAGGVMRVLLLCLAV